MKNVNDGLNQKTEEIMQIYMDILTERRWKERRKELQKNIRVQKRIN